MSKILNTWPLLRIISEHESDSEPNSITTHDIFQNSFPIENAQIQIILLSENRPKMTTTLISFS